MYANIRETYSKILNIKKEIVLKHDDFMKFYDKIDESIILLKNSVKELEDFADVLKEIKTYAITAVSDEEKAHVRGIYKNIIFTISTYAQQSNILSSKGRVNKELNEIGGKINSVRKDLSDKLHRCKLSWDITDDESAAGYRIIRNQELRTELLKIMDETEESLYICSPWISVSRLDNQDNIINKMECMLKEGVELKILYGYKDNENNNTDARKYLDSRLKNINNCYRIKRTNTHSKILISDKRKCWIGSCNLLSFGADYSNGHTRDEMMLEIIDEKLAKLYIDKEFDF